MRKLAQKIGYSPRTIYLYFSDKEALLTALVEEVFYETLQHLPKADTQQTLEDQLSEQFTRHINSGLKDPERYKLVIRVLQRKEHIPGSNQQAVEHRVFTQISQAFPSLGREEVISLMYMVFSTLRGYTLQLITQKNNLTEEDLSKHISIFTKWTASGLFACAKGV